MKTVATLLLALVLAGCSSSDQTTTRETTYTVQIDTMRATPAAWDAKPFTHDKDTVFVDRQVQGDVKVVIQRDTIRVRVQPAPLTIRDLDTVYITKTETTKIETPTFWEQALPWFAVGFLIMVVLIVLRFAKVL